MRHWEHLLRGAASMMVSLARDAHKKDLGSFQELLFEQDEVRTPDRTVLATHSHNRWREKGEGETFLRLDIVGPLVVRGGEAEASTLGPYMQFATVDGVAYVEQRVFAFWDLEHRDWYLVDLGRHWKSLRLCRAGT